MVDVLYTHEKLGDAVSILARHPGRIKERLAEAVHVALALVDERVFSQSGMQREATGCWRTIWSAVTSAPEDPRLGVYGPSIEKLTEEEASHVAELIVSLDSMVDVALDQEEAQRLMPVPVRLAVTGA
jgi:hypothetical protein